MIQRKISVLFLFGLLLLAGCGKTPIREDIEISLVSIDGDPYTGSTHIYEMNAGETKTFLFQFTAPKQLKEYHVGFDFEVDQSNYLSTKPIVGSTSGSFAFEMDVDELISNDIVVNGAVSKLFKITLIDEDGTLGNYSITIKKHL